ncbi:hypothetical protein QMK17_25425 [Rhodococcus sp. G-MC3]|nr:hypothetical protein [Rhodococcus sp. G-MC3]MDJ0396643.1 hypothetical protein [Rhodococcus sp. G-MC3]
MNNEPERFEELVARSVRLRVGTPQPHEVRPDRCTEFVGGVAGTSARIQ